MVGRPMPVKNILSTFGVPVPFHFPPKLIDLLRNSLFLFVSIFVIFPYCDKSLHEKGGLHQIASIVVISKRLDFPGVTMQPMGPYAMKAIGLSQKVDDFLKAIRTFPSITEGVILHHIKQFIIGKILGIYFCRSYGGFLIGAI